MTLLHTKFVFNFGVYLEKNLILKYLSQSIIELSNKNSSDFSKNIMVEVPRVLSGVIDPFINICTKLILFTLMLIFIFLLNYKVFLFILLLSFIVFISFANIFRNKLENNAIKISESIKNKQRTLNDIFNNIKELKLLNGFIYFYNNFMSKSKVYASRQISSGIIAFVPKFVIEPVIFALIIIFISSRVLAGEDAMSIMTYLSLYIFASLKLYPLSQQLIFYYSYLKSNKASFYIINKDFNIKKKKINLNYQVEKEKLKKYIIIENLKFQYNSKSKILKIDKLKIEKNSIIGIKGESGIGKSTLSYIILGLIDQYEGKIYFDDRLVDKKNLLSYQTLFSYVPQTVYLTDDTIRNNIALGQSDNLINEDRVIEISKKCQIYDFIMQLDKKFNHVVGEKGNLLSIGQIQRIGIARALYKNSDIILMDESTSSLDEENERNIMNFIRDLKNEGKTIIIISHKKSQLSFCDQVYNLNDNGLQKITSNE